MTTATGPTPVRRHKAGIRRGQAAAGCLFTAPAVIVLAVFLVIPIFMAPLGQLLRLGRPRLALLARRALRRPRRTTPASRSGGGLAEQDFGTSLRNNLWYVIVVVPIQTAVALLPRGARQQPDPEGARLLPHRLLLPVGDELGGDHGALALPLHPDRRRQQAARRRSALHGPNWLDGSRTASCTTCSPWSACRTARRSSSNGELPRRELVGLAVRALRRDDGLHHDGRLHDQRHVHAAVPRGAAEPRRRRSRRRRWSTARPPGSGSGSSRCRSCARRSSPC